MLFACVCVPCVSACACVCECRIRECVHVSWETRRVGGEEQPGWRRAAVEVADERAGGWCARCVECGVQSCGWVAPQGRVSPTTIGGPGVCGLGHDACGMGMHSMEWTRPVSCGEMGSDTGGVAARWRAKGAELGAGRPASHCGPRHRLGRGRPAASRALPSLRPCAAPPRRAGRSSRASSTTRTGTGAGTGTGTGAGAGTGTALRPLATERPRWGCLGFQSSSFRQLISGAAVRARGCCWLKCAEGSACGGEKTDGLTWHARRPCVVLWRRREVGSGHGARTK